jgi:molecular chaperone GrpE
MKKNNQKNESAEIIENGPSASDENSSEVEGNLNQDEQQGLDENEPVQELKVSPEEWEELRTYLGEMEIKAEEYLDGWQRSRAEFANYKKRIAREYNEIHQAAKGEVIKMYLDIADDLKRALDDNLKGIDDESWANGIEIIYQKLIARLESEGVKPMDALGEEFDPNIHEALMKEENDDYESGQVIEVIQEGYWIGEKVLRPAIVRVAA